MSKARILVVAADEAICADLRQYLAADFLVDEARDSRTCLCRLAERPPDLIVMDSQIRGLNGWTTLKRIRTAAATPVILLVPHASDRVRALQLGADDALSRPIDGREAAARAEAVLRRFQSLPARRTPAPHDTLTFEPASGTVTFQGRQIQLTPKQFEILALLATRPGQVVTRQFLFARLWGPDTTGDLRSIDRHVMHLRRKLGDRDGTLLANTWGIGYSFRAARAGCSGGPAQEVEGAK